MRAAHGVAARAGALAARRPQGPRARQVWRCVRGALAGVLITLLLTQIELSRISQVRPGPLVAAAGLLALSYALSALKWHAHIPDELGVGRTRATRLYFEGLFWNNFLPSSVGGDAVRGWHAATTSRGRMVAYASIAADRASSMFVMFSLGLTCALLGTDVPLPVLLVLAAGWAGSVVLLGGLLLRASSLVALRRPRRLALAGVLGLAVQLLQIGTNALVLVAVAGEPHALLLVAVIPVAAAISAIPISLNGLGLREGAVASLLIAGGVAEHDAALAVLMVLTLMVALSLPGGVFYLRSRRDGRIEPTGEDLGTDADDDDAAAREMPDAA